MGVYVYSQKSGHRPSIKDLPCDPSYPPYVMLFPGHSMWFTAQSLEDLEKAGRKLKLDLTELIRNWVKLQEFICSSGQNGRWPDNVSVYWVSDFMTLVIPYLPPGIRQGVFCCFNCHNTTTHLFSINPVLFQITQWKNVWCMFIML